MSDMFDHDLVYCVLSISLEKSNKTICVRNVKNIVLELLETFLVMDWKYLKEIINITNIAINNSLQNSKNLRNNMKESNNYSNKKSCNIPKI